MYESRFRMTDKDEKSSSGHISLNEIMGSEKPSEEAGSGSTRRINLDDLDLGEDLDGGMVPEPLPKNEPDENEKIDLEFIDGTGEIRVDSSEKNNQKKERKKVEEEKERGGYEDHREMPIPKNKEVSLSQDVLDDEIELERTQGPSDEISLDAGDGEEDDGSYEVVLENDEEKGLTGDELFEQSQSSIKTGGSALVDIEDCDDIVIEDETETKEVKKPKSRKINKNQKNRAIVKQKMAPLKKVQPPKATLGHHKKCNFCKVALRRFKLMTIYEDDQVIAIMDPKPLMKGQVLLCTKTHKSSLSDLSLKENAHFFNVAKIISDAIKKSKIPSEGVTFFLSESINESEELKHLYMSLIPRKKKDGIGLKFSKKNVVSSDDLELIGDHLLKFLSF